jgi:hypothetical protein
VIYPACENAADVLWELENAVGQGFNGATAEGGALLIDCGNAQLQDNLLTLDGVALGGGVLRVSRYKRNMSGEDIFRFVRELLRV